MDLILDLISWPLILLGCAFTIIGSVGVLRFPDVFTRCHAAGMVDTMGAGMILLGLMFQAEGVFIVIIKLVFIGFFLFFTSPVSSHALVSAAIFDGAKPVLDEEANAKLKGDYKEEKGEEK